MPNIIDANGLQTATQAELFDSLSAAMQAIYGSDINLDPDSPDAQMLLTFIQSVLDVEDFLTQIFNSFDPDNAIGTVLDQRVAINGIQRQSGTFTITNVTVSTIQALTLYGLDQDANQVFTVADNAGNQWQLITTQMPSSNGDFVYAFQSATPGAVLTVPNTITIPVTIVVGVSAVNNPTTYTTLGLNEETDAALRIRRQQSVALSSQGYYNGLIAALENVAGVTFAFVEENTTNSTNSDGVPGHSIWVIVAGQGAAVDIAQAIYTKRNAGCGMYGDLSYDVPQVDGTTFQVLWDEVSTVNLYISFSASSLDGINAPKVSDILTGILNNFVPGVAEKVNVNQLATVVQETDPNTLVSAAGFSLSAGGTYTPTLTPSLKKNQFVIATVRTFCPSISPFTCDVVHGGNTQAFTAANGRSTYTFSMVSSSGGGGSINSSSGVYTSGAIGTDVVKVVDSLGSIAYATVTVT